MLSRAADRDVIRLHRTLLNQTTPSEFGYKMQAVIGHILLRQGFEIREINQSGHPDIVAELDEVRHVFEIEADTSTPKPKQLTRQDFESLLCDTATLGWYGRLVNLHKPYWILVRASKLAHRSRATSVSMLMALSDREFSDSCTKTYFEILRRSMPRIQESSFGRLSSDAIRGQPL